MRNIEAIIFDMDGVMVDTLPLHHQASHELWERHGIDWTQELAQNIIGMRIKEALDWELQRNGLGLDLDQLVREREGIYLNLLSNNCQPMTGLMEVLDQVKGHYKLAVASSSEEPSVELVLDRFGIRDKFNFVAAGTDVKRSKPFPDIYLHAAKELGVKPENCVVVEDAEHGIVSAWLAGMSVIAVPNERTRRDNFSKAARVISNLHELNDVIGAIEIGDSKQGTVFKYHSVREMYGKDYLGNNPIFPKLLNYGDWEGLDFTSGDIDLETRIRSQENLYRRMLNGLGINKDSNVLEVACGNGEGGKLILHKYQPRNYLGTDFSYEQLERMRNVLGKENMDTRYSLGQAEAEELPFQDGKFDSLISVEAIQHFTKPQRFIEEAYRVLKQGGKVAFCSFFGNQEGNTDLLEKFIPTVSLGIDTFIPVQSLHKWLTDAGFKNIRIEPRGKHVWEPLVRWCKQVQPDQDWSENWLIAYKMGLMDYFQVYAEK